MQRSQRLRRGPNSIGHKISPTGTRVKRELLTGQREAQKRIGGERDLVGVLDGI